MMMPIMFLPMAMPLPMTSPQQPPLRKRKKCEMLLDEESSIDSIDHVTGGAVLTFSNPVHVPEHTRQAGLETEDEKEVARIFENISKLQLADFAPWASFGRSGGESNILFKLCLLIPMKFSLVSIPLSQQVHTRYGSDPAVDRGLHQLQFRPWWPCVRAMANYVWPCLPGTARALFV